MSSALDTIRRQIDEATPEETPEGTVCVIYSGKKGIRLVVDRESGRAIASNENRTHTVIHKDPALAAMRALSSVMTGGVA